MPPSRRRNGQVLFMAERLKVLESYNNFSQTMKKTSAVAACSKETGRSERTIWQLVKEQAQGRVIPPKRYKKPHLKRHSRQLKYKGDIRSMLRRIVHSCMISNVLPNLSTILDGFNASSHPTLKRNTIYNLLKESGFKNTRLNVNGLIVSLFSETPSIIKVRQEYLDKVKLAISQNRPIIYCGELFVPSGDIFNVLLTAGSEDGVLVGATETVTLQTKKEDPRMPEADFETWFAERVLPVCPPGALVVLDEREYHWRKERPAKNWTRKELLDWFHNGRMIANMQLTTESLYNLAVDTPNCGRHHIEIFADQHKVELLQLPPNHPELTPLTTIFRHIDDIAKVVKDLQTASDAVDKNIWYSAVQDVRDNETFLNTVDRMQRNLGELAERMRPCREEDLERIVSLQIFNGRKEEEEEDYVIEIIDEEEEADEVSRRQESKSYILFCGDI